MTLLTLPEVDDDRAFEARSLVRMLDSVLERVQLAFAYCGVELPERRYWTLAAPAADCEQLVVFLNQAYIGPPGDEATQPQRCDSVKSASMDVQVIRCIPGPTPRGKAPSAAEIQSGAVQGALDMFILLDSARDFDMWDPAGPSLGVIATCQVDEPQGNFQSVTMSLTMGIP